MEEHVAEFIVHGTQNNVTNIVLVEDSFSWLQLLAILMTEQLRIMHLISLLICDFVISFYRVMHFSAKRGLLSSVCLSGCLCDVGGL